MNSKLKICKHCKHSICELFLQCKKNSVKDIDLVTGNNKWIKPINCINARMEDYECGPEGKNYEPKMTPWECFKNMIGI